MESARIEWYRIPVDKDELRKLTEKSDLRGLLQTGSFLLIFVATTTLAFTFFRMKLWVPMLIACYLHSLFHQMVGMSAAVHELSHGTVFKSRWLNELFYGIFCFLTWNNPVHFRASHMLHHQYTVYRALDREVWQQPVEEKLNWVNYLSWATFDFKWFWKLMRVNVLHVLGKGNYDFFFWNPLFAEDDPRRKAMIRWARFAMLGHIALIVLFVALQAWVLIYLITFGSFFATILGRLTSAIQHTGLNENTPDWRMVCHSVKVNPLVGFLYWHMNYHIEHHMYAAVPCFNLGKFHERLARDLPVGPRSFVEGLRLVATIKKRQRQDPSYIYTPEFPPTAVPPKLA